LPHAYQGEINYLHALCTKNAKCYTMKYFQSSRIKILCATEAAGMVCHLSFVLGHAESVLS
jgi:hypothetical protein